MADSSPNVYVRGWRAYERGMGSFVSLVARVYRRLGAFTAHKPGFVLAVSILFALATCVGWIRFRNETDLNVLWVPQTGKSRDDGNYVKAYYPQSKAGASFYAQLELAQWNAYGGDNALQIAVTWEMFKLHGKVVNLTVTGDNGQQVKFQDICYKNKAKQCDLANGYLWYFYKSFDYFLTVVGGSVTNPAQGNETAFRQQVSNTSYPDGQPVSLLSVFGGTTYSFNPFKLTSARVIASDYALDNSLSESTVKAWNDAFTDLMKAELPKQTYMTFTWITGSSMGEELGKAIDGDMSLVIISLLIFIIVAIIFLSKLDVVKTRTTLALAGIVVICLGIMSGWGWGMIFGMPFTPLQQLSPFILLGMGVDVMFILVKSYDIIIAREPWLTLPESFSKLMSTAGLSVQVTLLASAVAFSLGAVDNLPSVKWFSAFACLNTLMIMALMMTTFVGFMVLTERRIWAGCWDCFCCCCRREPAATGKQGQPSIMQGILVAMPVASGGMVPVSDGFNVPGAGRTPSEMPGSPHAGQRAQLKDDELQEENIIKKFFRKYYAPALAKWWVKVPILLFFIAWAVAGFLGIYRVSAQPAPGVPKLLGQAKRSEEAPVCRRCTGGLWCPGAGPSLARGVQVQYGQPLSDLAPDGSYIQSYSAVQEATYAQQVGAPVGLYFRNLDFANPVTQYKMLKAWDMALQDDYVNATTTAFLGNWLVDFIAWAQKRNATVAMPTNNCYNPMIGKTQGDLGQVAAETLKTITGCIPAASYYTLLNQYMGTSSMGNVIRDPATGKIITCKLPVMLTAAGSDDKYSVNMIHSIHNTDSQISSELFVAEDSQGDTYVVFIYGGNFLFAEGDAELPQAAMIYFILALVGVGVVCTFMLVNPLASLLMMISVGLVVVYLFAELWALKIRFNQVSVINMVMAVGLSVDYSVYFAQKYMTTLADGTGNGRMKVALTDTGFAVFLGGLTALLGSIPMAFSKSVIIRTFFKLIFGTILFSLAVGLMLMPVVFSILSPLVPPVQSALTDGGDAGPVPPITHGSHAADNDGEDMQKGGSSKAPPV